MSKVALVTGGTRGIGAAISIALSGKGYQVIANYVGNKERAAQFSHEHNIPVYAWDISDYEASQEHIATIIKTYGPIDVLVNNAGITWDGMFHKMTFEQWNRVINVNVNGVFNVTQAVINTMREKNYGRIINISSINGQKGQIGQVNYATSKAALFGFTKALAQEVAKKGITVNTIAPGYVDTDMVAKVDEAILDKIIAQIPVGRLGTAEEIAQAVLFLASEEASFITGSTLTINGGQYLN